VSAAIAEGRIAEVRCYCETDVINTYLLYQRFRLMRGELDAGAYAAELSQVELRKLELARAMAAQPKLLISDEAMAGLAGNEVDEVLAILFKLNESGITIIMIEHIMQAVMRFSQRVVCLDAGKIIAEGTPQTIVQNPDVQRAYLGA
jgi:branched-chain amino acid transport system ATP-binding protein